MKFRFLTTAFLGLAAAFALLIPTAANAQTQRCFPETGYCISGPIRTYWERNGGLPVFGYPITEQRVETVEGRTIPVQWFERDRLEIQNDGTITAGRLGARLLELQGRPWQQFPPEQPSTDPDCRYFDVTHFNVCDGFRTYWERNGGLPRFGYPISPVMTEQIEGKGYQVQYFERRRMEYHPENAAPYNILLGLLGREVLTLEGGNQTVTDTLSGTAWQWTQFTNPTQQFTIDNPANYTIAFSNGAASIKADCNTVQATYTLGANNAITITPGASTRVACPPGSRGDEFVQKLSQVRSYSYDGANLLLAIPADGGNLTFASASSTAPVTDNLTGTAWQWTKYSDPTQQFEIQNPSSYTIAFDNGQVNIKADCNSVLGSYKVGASGALTITLGPTTLVACPEGSRGDLFVQKLSQVSHYSINGTTLLLELPADGGTLTFAKQ